MDIHKNELDLTLTNTENGQWWCRLLAGGVAGGVSRTCTAPLQRLKVFLQVNSSKQSISACATNLVKEGGIFGLWRGNLISVMKNVPESAIKFTAYHKVKKIIQEDQSKSMLFHERFVAGAVAGCVTQTTIYPMEVLKTRLELRATGQYRGMWDAARNICAKEGAATFYRGFLPNILGVIPYAGIELATYETLQQRCGEHPSTVHLAACAAVASSLGQLCTYPATLLRLRMQARQDHRSMTTMCRDIWRTQGLRGLYQGITANFIKVIPAVTINYVLNEHLKRALGVHAT